MPTIVDSLVVTLGLDASAYRREAGNINVYLKNTRESATSTAVALEERGKQGAQFFGQIKREALSLFGILLGAHGLEQFTKSAVTGLSALGRSASNIGVSVPGLAAFANMIERNGGNAQEATEKFFGLAMALERFKVMGQGEPQFIGALRAIGATPGENPLQIYMDFVRFAEQHKNEKLFIDLVGQHLGFDQSSINEAQKGIDQVKKDLAESYALGVPTEKMTKDMQQLQNDFIGAQQAARNLGNELLENLYPALDKLALWSTKEIKELTPVLDEVALWTVKEIDKNPQLVEGLRDVAGALIAIKTASAGFTFVGLGPLYSFFASVLGMSSAIIADLMGIYDIIKRGPFGSIPNSADTLNGMNEYRKSLGLPPLPQGGAGAVMNEGVPDIGTPARAEMEKTRDFLMSKGLTDDQTAGFLSSVASESGFDPTLWGDDGTSYGLFQEHADRLVKMQEYFGTLRPNADQQREWMWMELTTNPRFAETYKNLKNARLPGNAAAIVTGGFFVPKNVAAEAAKRANNAPAFSKTPSNIPDLTIDPFNHDFLNPTGLPPPSYPANPVMTPVPKKQSMNVTNYNIASVIINTKSTDANGIARDFSDALLSQANRGLS